MYPNPKITCLQFQCMEELPREQTPWTFHFTSQPETSMQHNLTLAKVQFAFIQAIRRHPLTMAAVDRGPKSP